jgi:thiamine transport system permease protein
VLRRGAAVAGTYAFAVSVGEFGATAFLVRPDTTTLPVAIYKLLSRPGADNLGKAMAAAVVLALITMAAMAVAEAARTAGGPRRRGARSPGGGRNTGGRDAGADWGL